MYFGTQEKKIWYCQLNVDVGTNTPILSYLFFKNIGNVIATTPYNLLDILVLK